MLYTILVVEDDADINNLLAKMLRQADYQVTQVYSGSEAALRLEHESPDLILLDLMLPGMSGEALLEKLRGELSCDAPVIILSAKTAVGDKVGLLKLGADDYITKPFNPLEVVARVRTQLRRASTYNHAAAPESAEEIDIRGLVINRAAHSCSLYGEQIALTPLEFEILWYLASNQGRVVPSEELFEAVWQEKYFKSNNTVMSHIGRLRDKLHEPPKQPKFIKTVWGIGYEIE